MRTRLVALTCMLALAVTLPLAMAGCEAAHADGAVGLSSPTPSASSASPSPSASPTETPPVSPTPTATPSKSKPPGNSGLPPLNCGGTATLDRPQASDGGPHGSHRSTGSRAVALTFDDGPDVYTSNRILDLLQQCGVKATFCVNGYKVAAAKEVIRRIVAEGHTLCNHTWRHIRQLGSYGPDLIRQDLADTNAAIRAVVPDAKISYFRAPGGVWTDDYIKVAQELGMTPIDWAVDPSDWDYDHYGKGSTMVNHIVSNVESNVKPGSIILSHDYQKPDTVAAYRILLPWLKARFTLIALPPDGLTPSP